MCENLTYPFVPDIERKNFILSIVLGIIFSFIFYSFLCLSREIIRVLSITTTFDVWILSDREVSFYNLFFAFLSLLFAQAICFSQWFGKNRKPFEKLNIQKTAIINDQWFLNNVFLCWFTRSSTLYALFIGTASEGGFYFFSFYPKYNFLFILILIVLFLQTWVSIRRVYKQKALKWMLISALSISVLAFAYSKINLVDYQKINRIILSKNIAYTYKLELAEVNTFEYLHHRNMSEIYVVKPSDTTKSTNPLILFNGNEFSFDNLEQELLNYMKPRDLSFEICRLHIDKSIKMSFINQLKEILTNTGFRRVGYAVVPKNREYDERFYTYCYSSWRLINKKHYENADTDKFDILLSVSCFNDSVQINNTVYPKMDFYSKIKQQVEKHDNYLVRFSVDDEMTFADYIFVLSEYGRAVQTVRNEYAIIKYSTEYEMLGSEEYGIIRNKKPVSLMEIDKTFNLSQNF